MWGGLLMLVFWVGIIIFVVMIFQRLGPYDRERYTSRNSHTALEIIKQRYAKGEITKQEFEEMKKSILV
jgi:putative membrane protein